MQADTLIGEVMRWRMPPKSDTGWHIIEVRDESGATHTVTGCSLPRPGCTVELAGEWQHSDRWGPQFFARTVAKQRAPLNPDGVKRWMREHVAGIGDKRAEALLASFGGDAAAMWQAIGDGGKALEGRGLTPELVRNIVDAFEAQGSDSEYHALMHGWGMTQRQISKVKKHWSLEDATRLLLANPYLLADHVDGFGFNRADEVARKLGIPHSDPVRVNAALCHFIEQHAGQGHVFVDEPIFRLIAREARLPLERLLDGVRELRRADRLVVEDGSRVYLPALHAAEVRIAEDLRERFKNAKPAAMDVNHLANATAGDGVMSRSGDTLIVDTGGVRAVDPWQQRAVELLTDMTQQVVFVTGGPGTGKTTVLKQALDELAATGVPVVLAAPTGKAAKRMTEATGRRASTLHSLLGYRPQTTVDCDVCRDRSAEFDYSTMNSAEPRLVVVDESSMVDVLLWAALAESAPGVRLAFVGDANQLPPVGPGQPFADALATAPAGAVCRLRTVFRSKGEWVKAAAPEILAGRVPELGDVPGLRWLERERADDIVPTVVQLMQGELDTPHFSAGAAQALGNMPVLSPQRTGAAGVNAINRALHELFNPPPDGDHARVELEDGSVLRANSWVMVIKNDLRKGVCNGDTGTVLEVADGGGVTFQLDGGAMPVQYTRGEAREQLRLAYSSTVHKSQGSEYPWVTVICHSSHKRMLTRRLLYTAVTRAKEGVVLIGDRAGVEWAIGNTREVTRCSWLQQRIRGSEGKPL